MSKRVFSFFSLLLLLICFVNGFLSIPQISVTADEADHFNYAVRSLKGHPEKVRPFDDASTMPISVLNTFPRVLQQFSHPELAKDDGGVSDIIKGRYLTLIVSLLTGVFILKWSTKLFGKLAGLFSLFLFTFCPNLNAHSVLVTTDAYSALFALTSAYFFVESVHNSSYKNLILFALNLAIAQLSKQSLTHLFIIFFLIGLFLFFRKKFLFQRLKLFFFKALFVCGIVVVVINIGFQFQQTGLTLKSYEFRSSFFKNIQANSFLLGAIPMPFPKPYIQGLDLTKNIDEMGGGRPESSDKIYILGESRKGRGFWYYYFVVLFFKTPIPIIASTILFSLFFLKRKNKTYTVDELVLIFMITYFLVYFDFFYRSQVGVRHIIMIFPLLYVLIGSVVSKLLSKKILLPGFIIYMIGSFYYYYPNLIAYTNEFILPKRNAYKFIADSNIDYNQSDFWLKKYLTEHPEIRMAVSAPQTGLVVVGINEYLDLKDEHKYNWLKNFTPVKQVCHSYLLFDISAKDLQEFKK